ncbi:preprotein translocase subunit SecG [Novosphingobium sp.]|uniref:preprotein translocase subunit SecG n=1 Tax=Novosphingobium sp. TaxID=1874826 RepID=UPI00286C69CD|nr:preprotein translocase subunit SecG [Novosphingobium sp.]
MTLMHFLTAIQAIVAALLVSVILMQKSEGGGLGTGGSPAGLMSARGAADFMTRLTTILAIMFVSLSIVLAAMATRSSGRTFDSSLGTSPAPVQAPGGIAPAPIGVTPAAAPATGAPAGSSAPVGLPT